MANKKMQELTKKTAEERMKLLAEKRDALRECHFGATGSRTRDTKLAMTLRKDIARLLTLAQADTVA